MPIKNGKLHLKIQLAIKCNNLFNPSGSPKLTQIGIFGLKIYHLATLNRRRKKLRSSRLTRKLKTVTARHARLFGKFFSVTK
jgi:hypothetical protein